MEMFRTLDIRGLSFFKSLQLATDEFTRIKKNGILEHKAIQKDLNMAFLSVQTVGMIV